MADVITRFKLETTQYDSRLRDATKSLAEYTRRAAFAGSEFGKFTKSNIDAARAIAGITPSATNAKDKVKELVSAFNDTARAYNALTKEQQQSDFGRALADSIGQLSQKVKQAKQELYGLGDEIKKTGGGGSFLSGMGGKLDGMLQVFGGNLMTKGAGMLASFAGEVTDMVKQGIELAKSGEGVRMAFERLGRGDILDGLRQATHGTVTDLELMKAAVKFNDFKLPVEELGTMLAFAQQKAKDTGQSVDYMVDSIVTGLGRKSLMILDNLGLSAAEIKSKMAETGDMTKAVGAIIREQMSKAGDYVETAADRATQATVSLENKMEELGRKFLPVQEASDNLWTSMKIGILDIIGGPLAKLLNKLTEAGRIKNLLGSYEEGDDNLLNRLRNSNNKWGEYASTYNDMLRKAKAEEEMARKIGDDIAYLNQIGGSAASGVGALATSQKGHEQRARELRAAAKEYAAGAKEILVTINKTDNAVEDVVLPPKTPKKTPKTTTPKATEVVPAGSVAALNNELQKLQKEQSKSVSAEGWKSYEESIAAVRNQIKELKGELSNIEAGNMASLAKIEGVSLIDMAAGRVKGKGMKDLGLGEVPTRESIIAKGKKKIQDFDGIEPQEKEDKTLENMQKMTSGLSSVASGLQQLGIKMPDGVQKVLGGIQGLMTVIQGVQTIISLFTTTTSAAQIASSTANTTMLAANTAAIGALTSVMATNTAVSLIPFAGGGIVGRAAGGMLIPGTSFSGDRLRMPVAGGRGAIGVNSGEVILNRAQQGVLADELQGTAQQGTTMQPYVDGEKIFLGMNNTSKRMGRGEIVTTSTLRRYGLI